MASRLFNVRLGPEEQRFAKQLRARGISVSDVVRRALRSEASKLDAEAADAARVLEEIFSEHPTPEDAPKQGPCATDRRAVQEHIRKRLRRRR